MTGLSDGSSSIDAPPTDGPSRPARSMLSGVAASTVTLLILFSGCAGGAPPIKAPTDGPRTTTVSSPTIEGPFATFTPSPASPSMVPTPSKEAEAGSSLGAPVQTEPPNPTTSPGPRGRLDPPPAVIVRAAAQVLELKPWTYCYRGGCVDGMAPWDPPNVGDPSAVVVEFALDGWTFSASFRTVGRDCARRQRLPVVQAGTHMHLLEPAGPAGTYDVTLFGRGPGGDLFVSFRWTTLHDGPMPVPDAWLSILANHDGEVDSYGVEFSVGGLATTPRIAAAEITVTAADGRSLTFEPIREPGCQGAGVVIWNGPDSAGQQVASLGSTPFTYDVVLELDGARYSASASWPSDVIEGNEPSVSLDFSPPLPALH